MSCIGSSALENRCPVKKSSASSADSTSQTSCDIDSSCVALEATASEELMEGQPILSVDWMQAFRLNVTDDSVVTYLAGYAMKKIGQRFICSSCSAAYDNSCARSQGDLYSSDNAHLFCINCKNLRLGETRTLGTVAGIVWTVLRIWEDRTVAFGETQQWSWCYKKFEGRCWHWIEPQQLQAWFCLRQSSESHAQWTDWSVSKNSHSPFCQNTKSRAAGIWAQSKEQRKPQSEKSYASLIFCLVSFTRSHAVCQPSVVNSLFATRKCLTFAELCLLFLSIVYSWN